MSKTMSKVRLNANIDSKVYSELKRVSQESNMAVTEYLENLLREDLKRRKYERLKSEFDRMASEESTKEALEIESECCNDGL